MARDGRDRWPGLNPMPEDAIFLEAVARYGPRIPLSIAKLQLLFQLGFNGASRLQARLVEHWTKQ